MTHDCKALIINNIKELLHHQDENKLTLDNLNRQNFGFPLRPYLSNWEPFFKATRALKTQKTKVETSQSNLKNQNGILSM